MSLSKVYKAFQMIDSGEKVISHPYQVSKVNSTTNNDTSDKAPTDYFLNDAKTTADSIIKDANEEAHNLIEAEKKKISLWWDSKRTEDQEIIEETKKKALIAGYSEGFETAEKELRAQYEDIFIKAQEILEESYKIKDKIIQESEDAIIQLSLLIAEKIINKEIESDSNIIIGMTKEILRSTKETDHISIFVNPDYFIYLHNAREDLSKELNGRVKLLIYPDPSITGAGIIIKTTSETFDAKIDTQLEEIKKILLNLSGGDKYGL